MSALQGVKAGIVSSSQPLSRAGREGPESSDNFLGRKAVKSDILTQSTVKVLLKLLARPPPRIAMSHAWPESHSFRQKYFWLDHFCLNSYLSWPTWFLQVLNTD